MLSTRDEVEDIAGTRALSFPVKLGISALCTGNSYKPPVLNIEELGETLSCGANFIGFCLSPATFGTLVFCCVHVIDKVYVFN